MGLALKAFFLVVGEARIALPDDLASRGEADIALDTLTSLLEAILASLCCDITFSEATSASLHAAAALAPSGPLASTNRWISELLP